METHERNHFNEILRERTFGIAIEVHKMLQTKKITMFSRPMVQQILRSSSSVAANTRAMTRARSDAEFYAKTCIVVEECDETQFWFDYLIRIGLLGVEETRILRNEVEELVKIFTSIKKKIKDKTGGK